MKKYLFISTITLVLFSAVLTSCSDEFVAEKPAYSIDSENYFNSKEEYDNALVAAYDLLQSTYVNVLLGEIASDNTLLNYIVSVWLTSMHESIFDITIPG